jgi:Ca2+-binding EF-hand superfamily protein
MPELAIQSTGKNDVCAVSKRQLLRFIQAKFQMADRDRDGRLNITELSNFLRFVSHPDLRSLRSWERFR